MLVSYVGLAQKMELASSHDTTKLAGIKHLVII